MKTGPNQPDTKSVVGAEEERTMTKGNGGAGQQLANRQYSLIAIDGDGTIVVDGKMPTSTRHALQRARAGGVLLVLVTGETFQQLEEFPGVDMFDLVVAENGAVLINPVTRAETVLGRKPPADLVAALKEAGLTRLNVGQSIVSTKVDSAELLEAVVARQNIDWHVVRNRRDAMILPSGIDKASGLAVALQELRVPAAEAVAIGDAENDAAMFQLCGLGVAVADAVPFLKQRSDLVTRGGGGHALAEVVERLL